MIPIEYRTAAKALGVSVRSIYRYVHRGWLTDHGGLIDLAEVYDLHAKLWPEGSREDTVDA